MKKLAIQNPWPVGLIIFFIIFIGYIVGYVVFASMQRMDLVRADYYDQEIRFQQQIDRVQRTAPILSAAAVRYDFKSGLVTVSLPPGVQNSEVTGTISFYRPSDASLDHDVQLAPDESGAQTVSVQSLRTGLWRVRLQWKNAKQDYYFEKRVIIGSAKQT